jgi:hypothetical protein
MSPSRRPLLLGFAANLDVERLMELLKCFGPAFAEHCADVAE